MASIVASPSGASPSGEKPSDIAKLWEEALAAYTQIASHDIRSTPSAQRNVASIIMEQESQLKAFDKYRHKDKIDKLRTVIASNTAHILKVSELVADATAGVFPPSVAILTAFTYLMKASVHVSEDYNMVESFFAVMQSFFLRLSLLENKVPPERNFQVFVINVLSSVLIISAFAKSYREKGRFMKWAKALLDGPDDELRKAYDTLRENLENLEAAIVMRTLRSALETGEETKALRQEAWAIRAQVGRMQASFDQNTELVRQNQDGIDRLLVGFGESRLAMEEVVVRTRGSESTSQELLRRQDTLAQALERLTANSGDKKGSGLLAGMSKPAHLNSLKQLVRNPAETGMAVKLREIRASYIERMFEWVVDEPAIQNLLNGQEQFVLIRGNAGTGKSHLAYKLDWYVRRKFSEETRTAVACFFFDDEHRDMRSVENMLRWCALKVAERNGHYCEEAMMDVRHRYNSTLDDLGTVWRALFQSKFAKDSKSRMLLILDGLDQIDEKEHDILVQLLDKIRIEEMRIQIILTSDKDRESKLSQLGSTEIELSISKLAHDKKIFARHQARLMPRLKTLRRDFRHSMIFKVSNDADSFLYIEHMMRRLNGLGGEVLIRKELKNQVRNIKALYEKLLRDCQKNRSDSDRAILRSLLAWLAYAKANLSIGEANKLVDIISQENSITIEEELNGRLARLLRISGNDYERPKKIDDSDEDSVLNDSDAFETDDEAQRTEDVNSLLTFQDRALRAYFRQTTDDSEGLRCSGAHAHAIILKLISAVLMIPKKERSPATTKLAEYASKWAFWHLLQIGNIQDASDDLTRDVLESLYNILSNKKDALKMLEGRNLFNMKVAETWEMQKYVSRELEGRTLKEPEWQSSGGFTIFNTSHVNQSQFLQMLASWAKRASRLPPDCLPYGVVEWFRPYVQDPSRVLLIIAREHISNWFSSDNIVTAYASFICAHNALQQAKCLPAVQQNSRLAAYLAECEKRKDQISEQSFEVIADAFWDIVKSPAAFRGIGMAMKHAKFYEAAVKQLDIGLEDSANDIVWQYRLQSSKGHALLCLGQACADERPKRKYLNDALDVLSSSIELYRQACESNSDAQADFISPKLIFQNRAITAALLGQHSLSLESIKSAIDIKNVQLTNDMVKDLIAAFVASEDPGQVVELLHLLADKAKSALTHYYAGNKNFAPIEEASARAGKGQYIAELYEIIAKELDREGFYDEFAGVFENSVTVLLLEIGKRRLKCLAAVFTQQALGDRVTAKRLLLEVINGPQAGPLSQVLAFEACNSLAQLLLEDFRLSTDHKVKKDVLNETRGLLSKMDEITDDFDRTETHVAVPIALMLRKLGPAVELAEVLNPAFRKCIEQLTDSTGANDSNALRRLARLLSCLPGFDLDAGIAASAQLYILDDEIYAMDLAREQDGSTSSDEPSTQSPDAKAGKPMQTSGEMPSKSLDQPADSTTDGTSNKSVNSVAAGDTASPMAPGLAEASSSIRSDQGITCNACEKDITDWLVDGPAYLCLFCFDFDLCEACYKMKLARETGELEADWHILCPEGHQHIKSPVEGWKGVSHGNLLIGDDEIPFKRWLVNVEVKWKAYWDEYWSGV
ncbi:hypothetical protein GQ53DRAFT_809831 [Thozetella sp. PMI_491]|nr:hypothetical protein GQ53DRAFT_809831 [Thozetella sp. PMI_491]